MKCKVYIFQNKICIFDNTKHSKIKNQPYDQISFCFLFILIHFMFYRQSTEISDYR